MNFFVKHLSLPLLAILFAGCASQARNVAGVAAPENVFSYGRRLPNTVQRVAVMPLVCAQPRADLPEGREALSPVLLGELIRTKRFEVVSAGSESLRVRTGRSEWSGAEALPADFFESLRRSYGCDAVLFSELTVFRAYAPISVGWRFKLVDVRTRQILWSADEVFDAPPPSVAKETLSEWCPYYRETAKDDWAVRNSPRQLGQYAAAQMFATLPAR